MQGVKSLEECLAQNDNDTLLLYLDYFMEEGHLEDAYNLCLKMPQQSTTMYILGQLTSGKEAESFYIQGIEYDINARSKVAAYLSIVEIYMTDLCDEPDASEKCNSYLQNCLDLHYETAELYFTLADVRMCQCDSESAQTSVLKAIELYVPKFDDNTIESELIPSYDSRIKGAKVCIELNMIDSAFEILKTCEQEYDEDLDLLYLNCFCYFALSKIEDTEENLESCKSYLQKLLQLDIEKEYLDGIQDMLSVLKLN
eukprot:NODE_39_length_35218_cov_0.479655.p16 type:complete len:256 gc:universal NODE_39_length_35218_cov_0.479655:30817-31584(+)